MTSNHNKTQIAIIGGGISGLCTAYFLLKAGFEVTILEQHNNVAEEGTLGNSGIIAPASLSPISLPGIVSNAFTSRFTKTPAILPVRTPSFSRWSWHKKNRAYIKNDYLTLKENLAALHTLGANLITDLQEEHQLDHENSTGIFRIIHKLEESKRFEQTEAFLKENELSYRIVDEQKIKEMEPSFVASKPFMQAEYYPNDGAGNCVLFSKQLKQLIHDLGGQFKFNAYVKEIEVTVNGDKLIHYTNDTINADAIVVCAGINSAHLVKPLGIHLPLHQVYSYLGVSMLKNDEYAPNHSFIDETYRVSMTKLGNRVRLAGLISYTPYNDKAQAKAAKSLLRFAQDFFPNTINYDTLNIISRAYAVTPTGLPLLGTTGYNNLFINTAHGQNGWATAIGTAKLLTEHILGHNKSINSPLLFSQFENK